MAEYKPLFVYLEPASIPQVVAHIQKYLAENPIISDPEAIAEAIQKYIEEHPEIIAVASVNGKVGAVVLTGSDIMINPSSAVSLETQLLNLASMIQSTSGDITQIESQLETIYTNIGTIETNVSNNTSAIEALQTSVEGQGTRLAGAESDIDALESAQSAQGTRLNTAEGNISSLQTRMTQAETDINTNESNIESVNEDLTSYKNSVPLKSGDTFVFTNRVMLCGLLTGASKALWFTLSIGRKITAQNVGLTTLSATLRGVSGYIDGAGGHDLLASPYVSQAYIADYNGGLITFNVTKSTEFTGATNNTPIVVEILPSGLQLDFS